MLLLLGWRRWISTFNFSISLHKYLYFNLSTKGECFWNLCWNKSVNQSTAAAPEGTSRTDSLWFVFPSSVSKGSLKNTWSTEPLWTAALCLLSPPFVTAVTAGDVTCLQRRGPTAQKSIHRSVYGKCKISEPIEVVFFFYLKTTAKKKARPISRFLLVGSF